MPGGDRTGPMARGSMTGRGRGICGRLDAPQSTRCGFGGGGRGFGRGAGGGEGGWRNRVWATTVPGWTREESVPSTGADNDATAFAELQRLERRAAELEAEQEQIRARLNKLEA